MGVGPRFCSTRVFVMTGGLTGSMAYLLNSFATNAEFLLFSQGVCYGMTHALVHNPTIVILGKYFEKRRGFANLISAVGGSVGTIVVPIIVRNLINQYGLQGSLMVVSAMLLNFIVIGALLRPFNITEKKNSSNGCQEGTKTNFEKEREILSPESEALLTNKSSISQINSKFRVEKYNGLAVPNILILKSISTSELHMNCDTEPVERLRSFSTSSHTRMKSEQSKSKQLPPLNSGVKKYSLSRRVMFSECSFLSLDSHQLGDRTVDVSDYTQQRENENSQACDTKSCCVKFLCFIFDKRVVSNYLFLMYLPVASTAMAGLGQFLIYVPPHAAEIGLTPEDVSHLFIISGASDIASKLSLSLIADCHFIKSYQLIAIGLITFGSVTHLISFFTDFNKMIILVATFGLFGRIYLGLSPVLVAEFVGIENLSAALGILVLVHGISSSVSNAILGYIRDVTGSFIGSFHFMATLLIISGTILLMEPLVRRFERRRLLRSQPVAS